MDLFRKSAMQKMLSPDDLDQLMQITKPKDWIALLGVCGILAAFVIWFFIGTIAINISGQGILLKKDGYRIIESPTAGQITKITEFKPGDIIQAGQEIAEIAQPLLQLKIAAAKTYLTNLEQLQQQNPSSIKNADQLNIKIASTRSNLQYLENQYQINSRVLSPYTGHFLAMRTNLGVQIKVGDSLLSMEDVGKKISAIIFLPPTTSNINAIQPGMFVKVFPGLEKTTENRYLIGKVNNVSKYPVSPEIMSNLLNNDFLVNYFSKNGPPYMVDVDLIVNPDKLNQYKLALTVGKKTNISSGTLCSADIEIANKHPINFLLKTSN